VGYAEPLRSELVAFVNAIRSGETPAVTGEEAVASLEIATRCLQGRAMPAMVARRHGPRRVAG
jgi:predicted dehydrogenase